jgi:hypothetical protein
MPLTFGYQAKLYRNTGTYGTPAWNEVPNVRDVTMSLTVEEDDVTTRGGNGWKQNAATLKDASVDFEMIYDKTDPDFTAFKDAFLNSTAIDVAVMDGDITVTGNQGLRAEMMVTKFDRMENLTQALKVSVTIKPTYSSNAPTWYTVP